MAKDIRFKWKDELRQARDVSRGAKHFGCYMVDRRIFKAGGKCNERNKTLAAGMGVCVRTLQRYVRELERSGWIILDRVSETKRTIRLRYPWQDGEAVHRDRPSPVTATKMSAKDDKDVTPYNKIKHVSNNGQRHGQSDRFAVIQIQRSEDSLIVLWKEWIEKHSEYCFEEVLSSIASGAAYNFPSRYTPEDEATIAKCLAYFRAMCARPKTSAGQELQ